MKIRHDEVPEGESRYRHFSSSFCGGRSSRNRVHVPLHESLDSGNDVRITEGEIKADFATLRTDVLTLSIPGVPSWRLAFDVLSDLPDVRTVKVALDADARDKPEVAYALRQLVHSLNNRGYNFSVERWG